MKICIVGKYPPIEGGVSAQTCWLARGLAQRGHEIHVVTNAPEVEDNFRLTFHGSDDLWYQPEFGDTGGRVRVYTAEPFHGRTMGHIPASNPFVSKLASLATDIVRRHDCEVVLAYYYEPYAVAGWLASKWTGCPFVVKHAGSDLDRLFAVPDLATTYKEILRSADVVITQRRLMPRFLGMGVHPERLRADAPYALPADVFNPAAEPLDVAHVAVDLTAGDTPLPVPHFDPSRPSIGTLGKIGVSKGTFDLIASLGRLAREGLEFNFLALVGAAQAKILAPALKNAGIEGSAFVLPMLPNWRVPAFIRACAAVCFLERDFPVEIHGPTVPREVLACGTCLVLSGEIAAKQRYREQLVNGENVLLVDDPKDHEALAAALRSIVTDPARAAMIGAAGSRITASTDTHENFIAGWEDILGSLADARRGAAGTEVSPRQRTVDGDAALNLTIPDLVSFMRRKAPDLVDRFLQETTDGSPFAIAVRFCDFASVHARREAFAEDLPRLHAALRYTRARVLAAHDPDGDHTPAFPVLDILHGAPVTKESVWALRPIRGEAVRIEAFDFDVSGLFLPHSVSGGADYPTEDLSAAGENRLLVLFQRSANLIARELRIDDATRELVARCDGTSTTGEVVESLRRYFGVETTAAREALTGHVLGALDRLYRAKVIVFGEHKPGWGWTGGERATVPPVVEAPARSR